MLYERDEVDQRDTPDIIRDNILTHQRYGMDHQCLPRLTLIGRPVRFFKLLRRMAMAAGLTLDMIENKMGTFSHLGEILYTHFQKDNGHARTG